MTLLGSGVEKIDIFSQQNVQSLDQRKQETTVHFAEEIPKS